MCRVVVALAVMACAGIVPAEAANTATPCRHHACKVTIAVPDGNVLGWVSPQQLHENDNVVIWAYVGRHRLVEQDGGGCVAYEYGQGVAVRLDICGHGRFHIRLRASDLAGHRQYLRLIYLASPEK